MLAGHFRVMARNNAWSNYRLHNACAQLSEAEYRAQRVSFFPSIPLTLSHILTVDWYYLDALEKGGRGYAVFEKDEPYDTLAELTAAQLASDRRLLAFCDGLGAADVTSAVILDRGAQGKFEETAAAVLSHLFVHQIHHRGQVHAMLAGTSVKPPQLDEYFLEQDAPVRRDELRALALA
ncbi:MAG TPA: DinB family protein [Dongiaceae bacterium]|nr:DinB family protein [Dongiaceae bacterium]